MKVGVATKGTNPEIGVIVGDKMVFSTFSFFGKANERIKKEIAKQGWEHVDELNSKAALLLNKALAGEDVFEWSILSGAQKKVLRELRGTSGKVTYGELARRCDTGARAVGAIMRSNPFTYFIPCHRVVAKNGEGGFAIGLEEKRKLLESELL